MELFVKSQLSSPFFLFDWAVDFWHSDSSYTSSPSHWTFFQFSEVFVLVGSSALVFFSNFVSEWVEWLFVIFSQLWHMIESRFPWLSNFVLVFWDIFSNFCNSLENLVFLFILRMNWHNLYFQDLLPNFGIFSGIQSVSIKHLLSHIQGSDYFFKVPDAAVTHKNQIRHYVWQIKMSDFEILIVLGDIRSYPFIVDSQVCHELPSIAVRVYESFRIDVFDQKVRYKIHVSENLAVFCFHQFFFILIFVQADKLVRKDSIGNYEISTGVQMVIINQVQFKLVLDWVNVFYLWSCCESANRVCT